jgi:hypothetical protein
MKKEFSKRRNVIINHDNAHKRRLIVKSEISETLKFYSVTTHISKGIRMLLNHDPSGLIMYVEEMFKM